jgi:hypothetical protein
MKVKNEFLYKILITLIGLVIITFFVKYAMLEVDRMREKHDFELAEKQKREGFVNWDPLGAGKTLKKVGKDIDKQFAPLVNSMDKLGDTLKGGFMNGLNGLIGGIEDMVNGFVDAFNFIEQGIQDIQTFFKNLKNFGEGVQNHLQCGSKQYRSGWQNAMPIIPILMECSWQKFINFFNGQCTRYYIFDMIFGIWRGIFIELPFAIINGMTGIDLHFITDIIYEVIVVPIDTLFHMMTGYHFLVWSDKVIEKCYRCKGTITSNTGQNMTFVKPFDWWVRSMRCGVDSMNNGLENIFGSILPNPKWGAWAQGDTFDRNGYSGGYKNGKFILEGSNMDPSFFGPLIPMVNPNRKSKARIPKVRLKRL